ncbi:MAG TPA: hypothetical protein VMT93_09395 [Gemmatimonadaceae bacterium]|nr:hypothetical protein [Gemmatimonadaceae bacterium]
MAERLLRHSCIRASLGGTFAADPTASGAMDDRHPTQDPHSAITRRAFLGRGAALGAGLAAMQRAPGQIPTLDALLRDPLDAAFARQGDEFTLGNAAILGAWSVANGAFRVARIVDRVNGTKPAPAAAPFSLALADGGTIAADAMTIVAGPRAERLAPQPASPRQVERVGGWTVAVTLRDAGGRVEALWRGVLRDGSRYLRQEVTLNALGAPLAVREIVLVDLGLPGATVSGSVKGSPVTGGGAYAAFEHPLSASTAADGRARAALARELPLRPGAPFTVSSVFGVTRTGQMRRDFLAYIERERAHPYRTFLHYNSWYDIGYFSKYAEPDALAVIAAYASELHEQRGVVLDSFLFDDGWDDPATLWGFHAGFPQGFSKVRDAAAACGAAPGVWMSPWGGYGKPQQERLANGRAQGFETNAGGFQLSGPKYYQRFRDTCLDMIRRYGVNQFKFDGTGNAASAFPGSVFDSDFDAAIALIGDLRAEEPGLFVNLTTGTYPSPFWLRYADSIWRGGDDHDFAGVGSWRQKWITYRDADTYAGVVKSGPLYPLNSLMLHGLIYARHAKHLSTDPQDDFPDEVRSYFGTGTQLQEMYVTPSLLGAPQWDVIAECARWSRAHAATLADTHWIGGDPAQLEPYGWAAWSPAGATLTLRNPSGKTQEIAIDPAAAFELPEGAPRAWTMRSPWRKDRGAEPVALRAGAARPVRLEAFEVKTFVSDAR